MLLMKSSVTITDLVRNFSDYFSRVFYRGESFTIKKGREMVAELRPLPRGQKLSALPELLKNLPRLSDSELESFASDIDAARSNLPMQKDTAWES